MENLINLDSLSEEEKSLILSVIKRDEELKHGQDSKIAQLKIEIHNLRKQSILRGEDNSNKICIRCRKQFGFFFDTGEICTHCKYKICNMCRETLVSGGWLCTLCYKQMQLKWMTGEWIYGTTKKCPRYMPSGGDVIKASIRRSTSNRNIARTDDNVDGGAGISKSSSAISSRDNLDRITSPQESDKMRLSHLFSSFKSGKADVPDSEVSVQHISCRRRVDSDTDSSDDERPVEMTKAASIHSSVALSEHGNSLPKQQVSSETESMTDSPRIPNSPRIPKKNVVVETSVPSILENGHSLAGDDGCICNEFHELEPGDSEDGQRGSVGRGIKEWEEKLSRKPLSPHASPHVSYSVSEPESPPRANVSPSTLGRESSSSTRHDGSHSHGNQLAGNLVSDASHSVSALQHFSSSVNRKSDTDPLVEHHSSPVTNITAYTSVHSPKAESRHKTTHETASKDLCSLQEHNECDYSKRPVIDDEGDPFAVRAVNIPDIVQQYFDADNDLSDCLSIITEATEPDSDEQNATCSDTTSTGTMHEGDLDKEFDEIYSNNLIYGQYLDSSLSMSLLSTDDDVSDPGSLIKKSHFVKKGKKSPKRDRRVKDNNALKDTTNKKNKPEIKSVLDSKINTHITGEAMVGKYVQEECVGQTYAQLCVDKQSDTTNTDILDQESDPSLHDNLPNLTGELKHSSNSKSTKDTGVAKVDDNVILKVENSKNAENRNKEMIDGKNREEKHSDIGKNKEVAKNASCVVKDGIQSNLKNVIGDDTDGKGIYQELKYTSEQVHQESTAQDQNTLENQPVTDVLQSETGDVSPVIADDLNAKSTENSTSHPEIIAAEKHTLNELAVNEAANELQSDNKLDTLESVEISAAGSVSDNSTTVVNHETLPARSDAENYLEVGPDGASNQITLTAESNSISPPFDHTNTDLNSTTLSSPDACTDAFVDSSTLSHTETCIVVSNTNENGDHETDILTDSNTLTGDKADSQIHSNESAPDHSNKNTLSDSDTPAPAHNTTGLADPDSNAQADCSNETTTAVDPSLPQLLISSQSPCSALAPTDQNHSVSTPADANCRPVMTVSPGESVEQENTIQDSSLAPHVKVTSETGSDETGSHGGDSGHISGTSAENTPEHKPRCPQHLSIPSLVCTSADEDSRESLYSIYSDAGEINYGKIPVTGEILFGLDYNYKSGALEIYIKQCKDLAPVDTKRNRSDPYVKTYLLPDKTRSGKRKTKIKKHTLNPKFDEVIRYVISKSEIENRVLWVTVWHNDRFGRNDFLGEVMISLECYKFGDSAPRWYLLQERLELPESSLCYKGDLVMSLKYVTSDKIDSPSKKEKSKKIKETSKGELHVFVKESRNLTAVRSNGTSDPFCKGYLLPEKNKSVKQKTPVVKRNCSPEWNHIFLFEDVSLEELAGRSLELTVWDHDRITSNDFLGGVRLNLGTGAYNGLPVEWMDAHGQEVYIWKSMLERPNTWVNVTVGLRHTMGKSEIKK
ncbi:uncharacterized protein LOC121370499 isoform X2 [Gigantopelta aegis]|uniref:uncharacterized protein LOC121370499 isoform X2 n=1 Tax=Gigantopelta aegis TaxID=1735272 RepID=UPI001B888B85|nr:uncharacterized protein LOC121370499 isoform X2 [Gigantopelta aegis]